MTPDNKFVQLISTELQIPETSVRNTLKLLADGSTIAFIARYRKELTRSLTEVEIEMIKNKHDALSELVRRKAYVLNSIDEQNQLNPHLKNKIENCWDPRILEDLYLPFKKKKKSKASQARDKGLEGLAKIILAQHESNINVRARRFLNNNVKDITEAIQGACNIIAEWISENSKTREYIRSIYEKTAVLQAKVIKSKMAEASKYKQYFDYKEALSRIPSHRLLAILRASDEGYLKIKLLIDHDRIFNRLKDVYIKDPNKDSGEFIENAIIDSCKRLLLPSLENERLKTAKQKADEEAISVFRLNLKQLLLSSPLGSKNILAIDPGFRTGCKIVVLNKQGSLVDDTAIFPHPPLNNKNDAELKILSMIRKYNIEAIAIGNGTAGKETYQWLSSLGDPTIPELYFVNESGASIYSASALAREEFPDKDVTVRGAISIGRRLMDPLAELVKIDPKSIGVGQYQHDVNQTLLKESLESTVQSCVNSVGINLNTASVHLLSKVSGLGPVLAGNIIKYRDKINGFQERKELLGVPRMGPKAYQMCAGFLRIKDGKNMLDNTAVHPESYKLIKKISSSTGTTLDKLISNSSLLKSIDLKPFVNDKIGMPTLKDIIKELEKPGLDPRGQAKPVLFSNKINSIEDLQMGMILPGIVNNITRFGAFVDIGVKESGLLHISQIADSYIQDPSEVLSLNQEIQVKIIELDAGRKRISLSMKQV